MTLIQAADEMAKFSFSALEKTDGYQAAILEFCRLKRQLRVALADELEGK